MELSEKKAFPVKIGAMTLYCEKMTLSADTAVTVNPTVTGSSVVTNKCKKVTRLSFTGRIYNKEKPMFYAGFANNLNGNEGVEIIYRDLRFVRCIITGIKAVDGGEDFVELTVEASTRSAAYFLDGVTE
jgi:hypothetical protein